MKYRKILIIIFLLIAPIFVSRPQVLAADKEFCDSKGHGASSADPWVNTALGCVPVKIDGFLTWMLPPLFGIIGGVAFLLMIYGFILLTVSGGEPKAVAGAQETITSAIYGLLTSIFAIFILRLIAVGILKIPGLS
jgi:hypothetical protein